MSLCVHVNIHTDTHTQRHTYASTNYSVGGGGSRVNSTSYCKPPGAGVENCAGFTGSPSVWPHSPLLLSERFTPPAFPLPRVLTCVYGRTFPAQWLLRPRVAGAACEFHLAHRFISEDAPRSQQGCPGCPPGCALGSCTRVTPKTGGLSLGEQRESCCVER